MKTGPLLLLLSASLALGGCARNYVISLNNGRTITAASKPKLQAGNYVFQDAEGKLASVPAGRVREVAPASMIEKKREFKRAPARQ